MLLLKRCRVTAPSSSASTTRTYIASTLGTQTLGRHEALNPLVPRHVVDAAGKIISPWHDIPMRVGRTDDSLHNFVCCVPRGSSATIDVSRNLPHNPLAHAMDSRSGKPSYFPFASLVNYGVLPQTFANPSRMDTKSGLMGDGALLHVCEIGEKQAASGSVYPVRILGGLATVDGGGSGNTVHWRLLAIRADDPIAGTLRDVSDASGKLLRLLEDIRAWFRTHTVSEGKPENGVAFEGRFLGRNEVMEVMAEQHLQWNRMCSSRAASSARRMYGSEPLQALKQDQIWVPAGGRIRRWPSSSSRSLVLPRPAAAASAVAASAAAVVNPLQ